MRVKFEIKEDYSRRVDGGACWIWVIVEQDKPCVLGESYRHWASAELAKDDAIKVRQAIRSPGRDVPVVVREDHT